MADFLSTQSGPWNDGATWGNTSPGAKGVDWPGAPGDTATVAHQLDYAHEEANELGEITIASGGVLEFSKTSDTLLAMGHASITVESGGELRAGTENDPIPSGVLCRILFNPTANNQKGIQVETGGAAHLNGDPAVYGSQINAWLAADWTAGQQFEIEGDLSAKWQAGQKVSVHKGGSYGGYNSDVVEFTIADIEAGGGNTLITIEEAAPGETFARGMEVCNLSRNVVLERSGLDRTLGNMASNAPWLRDYANPSASTLGHLAILGFYEATRIFYPRSGQEIEGAVIRNGRSGTWDRLLFRNCLLSGQPAVYGLATKLVGCSVFASYHVVYYGSVSNEFDDCRIYACWRLNSVLAPMRLADTWLYGSSRGIEVVSHLRMTRGGIGLSPKGVACPNDLWDFTSPVDVRLREVSLHPDGLVISGLDSPNAGPLFLGCRNHDGAEGVHRAWRNTGETIRNTTTVRDGGAADSVEAIPYSGCDLNNPLPLAEWEEADVPAAEQKRSVHLRAEGWTALPGSAELLLEAEYLSSPGDFTTSKVVSSEALSSNDVWEALTINYTPARTGPVRYTVKLLKYEAAAKVFLDSALYRGASHPVIKTAWRDGLTTLDREGPIPLVSPTTTVQIEDAMVAALENLGIFRHVGSAGRAEVPKAMQYPSAFIYLAGEKDNSSARPVVDMTFEVAVINRNLRSERDAANDTYALIDAVRDSLENKRLGIGDIEPLHVTERKLSAYEAGIVTYMLKVKTRHMLPVPKTD